MEHVKSTLATTAFAVLGLVAAAHVLHPQDPSLERPRTHQVPDGAGEPASQGGWVTPPARTASAGPATVRGAGTASPAPVGLAHPASFTLVTPDILALPALAVTAAVPIQDAGFHRRRTLQVGARQTQRAARRVEVADRRSVDRDAAAPVAGNAPGQGDPIGDLLRKLGLGEG